MKALFTLNPGKMVDYLRRWVDWSMDQVRSFDVEDCLWLKTTAVLAGMLLGVSCSSVLKKIMPLMFIFFFFSAYKLMAPRLGSFGEMVVGDYDKDIQKFSSDYDTPDFI